MELSSKLAGIIRIAEANKTGLLAGAFGGALALLFAIILLSNLLGWLRIGWLLGGVDNAAIEILLYVLFTGTFSVALCFFAGMPALNIILVWLLNLVITTLYVMWTNRRRGSHQSTFKSNKGS